MSKVALVEPGHNKLDFIKRRIIAGHERATKGGAEWIEGSLEIAAALLEGRDNRPDDIGFGEWLEREKLDFYNKNDRAALIHLAGNLDIARAVLSEATSRSYENIWREFKGRFPMNRKPTTSATDTDKHGRYKKPRNRNMRLATIHRRMKLGDEIIDSLKGTSLDSAPEMQELVRLNRGAPEGELTEVVQHLVAEAVAGKDVSAIGETSRIAVSGRAKRPSLITAWRKRMVFAWDQATHNEQEHFVLYLTEHMKERTS